ncbi:hypothetical protein HOD61_03130 [archaeon]|jgi:hypothetical protein|nr:hypothetical protein [archaeon]
MFWKNKRKIKENLVEHHLNNLRTSIYLSEDYNVDYKEFFPVLTNGKYPSKLVKMGQSIYYPESSKVELILAQLGINGESSELKYTLKLPYKLRSLKKFKNDYSFVAGHEEAHLLCLTGNSKVLLDEYCKYYKGNEEFLEKFTERNDRLCDFVLTDELNSFETCEGHLRNIYSECPELHELVADVGGLISLNKKYESNELSSSVLSYFEKRVFSRLGNKSHRK